MAEALYQREVYGKTLVELGKDHQNIIVLDADLSSSTKTKLFGKAYPERFFNFGVAEQNMMATAAGLASCGKVVFASTFAMFATGRAWDQLRNSVCYNNFNVKLVATHAGVSVGEDGASHQAIEDIALMRSIPNMKIIVPCDGPETKDAVIAALNTPGPFYIRLSRAKVPTIEEKKPFKLGKSCVIKEGNDVSIFACGIMVEQAIKAEEILKKEGISARVINMHTLRPLDEEMIIKCVKETKGLVVCEEHTVVGGLASAIDEVVCENIPTKVIRVGIRNRFGQSGSPAELLKEYNLTGSDIVIAAKKVLSAKGG
ncbi:MAG: transketolase family protein [Candidatus Omnitrophica bacterium]|nr:transketolase family protein [Candidatus Omnitrophota bacterium]MDD5352876.1 transketolase family protein [Candidatus Omnitrophota bacterium]MDD5550475.1 transketolase family protein [Candidatus Omnitrophota bacterium]